MGKFDCSCEVAYILRRNFGGDCITLGLILFFNFVFEWDFKSVIS